MPPRRPVVDCGGRASSPRRTQPRLRQGALRAVQPRQLGASADPGGSAGGHGKGLVSVDCGLHQRWAGAPREGPAHSREQPRERPRPRRSRMGAAWMTDAAEMQNPCSGALCAF